MPRKPSASQLDDFGYAVSAEDEELQVITVASPLAGYHDLGNAFAVPSNGAEAAENVTFESLAIEKMPGRVQVGSRILDSSPADASLMKCFWGYQQGFKNGGREMLRVNGPYLYKLDDSNVDPSLWTWKGAVSGSVIPTTADVIGSGVNLGTAVQKQNRIHYADGGELRRMYIATSPSRIVPWGSDLVLGAPTIVGETDAGGSLTNARNYRCAWQLINEDTGFKTSISAFSSTFLTTGTEGGAEKQLAITLPLVENWTPDWSIARIFRTPGSLPPSVPSTYKFEYDIEGIANLDIYDHMGGLLTVLDGDLGDEAEETSAMIPKARYVLYDPNGDRCVAFGNPDDPNVMYWSEDGDFGNFPSTNATPQIEDNDGDPLTGGAVLDERIYLIKRYRGIFSATQNSVGAYAIGKVCNGPGCVSFHSVITRGARIYWLSDEGAIEFQGQTPVNFSDEKIRKFLARAATSDKYVEAYGLEERKSGSAFLHWLVWIGDESYRLVFDLNLRSWSIARAGSSASGTTDRVLWNGLDDDDGDNAFHIYTGDATGRCFRLGSDVDGTPVYHSNGEDYTMLFETRWFGNGLDTYVPRYFDFLTEVVANDGMVDQGNLRVGLYLDGRDDEQHGKDYPLRTTADLKIGDKLYSRNRFHADSLMSPVSMFKYKLTHAVKNGKPLIPWYRVKFKAIGPRLR